MIGGTDPERGAVVDALAAIAAHGGPTGLLTALRHAPVEGWSELAERMAADAGPAGAPGAEVQRVRAGRAGVELALADGTSCRAARAVLALPVNTLPAISFEPALPDATAEALGINAGRAHKVWLRARGVPAGVLAAGAGDGLHWLYADRMLDDGDVLLLGFGYEDPAFDPGSHADVERALHAVLPRRRAGRVRPPRLERRPVCARHLGDGAGRAGRAAHAPSASRRTGGSPSRPRTWLHARRAGSRARCSSGAAAARWALSCA